MGNNALLKQIVATSESMPFMNTMLDNLTSEDGRAKCAKDFARFNQDVKAVFAQTPKLGHDSKPVLDELGVPVMTETAKTITAAFLTSGCGFWTPITIKWHCHRVVLFPAATVNGRSGRTASRSRRSRRSWPTPTAATC